MGSPRRAFDIDASGVISHTVSEQDNRLGVGASFPGCPPESLKDVDLYAVQKELYLGRKCEVSDVPGPWQFWMVMLKNGNLDTGAALCPSNGRKAAPFPREPKFPCFGAGCMNQPLVYQEYTARQSGSNRLGGRFYGSYDLDANLTAGGDAGVGNVSYYSVTWEKDLGSGGWAFHHVLKTSKKYPWLMLYLRSDDTRGFSGGYHYETRGMTKIIPESPNFKVKLTLDIKQGGGPSSQFYLMDMGSCWKNNGDPCNGDTTTDVIRYSEMILNSETPTLCRPDRLYECPPYHTFPNGTRVHQTDKANFPYDAYHIYCARGMPRMLRHPTYPPIPTAIPSLKRYFRYCPSSVGELRIPYEERGRLDWGSTELGT